MLLHASREEARSLSRSRESRATHGERSHDPEGRRVLIYGYAVAGQNPEIGAQSISYVCGPASSEQKLSGPLSFSTL